MNTICTCPKCGSQLELKLTFASGPKSPVSKTGPINDLLESAEAKQLDMWETEFITSLRSGYDRVGENIKLTSKQRENLEKIANRP